MTFVELCCGTAAVSLHLLGGRTLGPYMGGKSRFAAQIAEYLPVVPDSLLLVDTGEWAHTLRTCIEAPDPVASALDAWASEPDRDLFDLLRSSPPFEDGCLRAASHLYLQARTYRSKPVYPTTTGWKTHGFDPEQRDTKNPGPNTNARRGTANGRTTLANRVRALNALRWPTTAVAQIRAQDVVPFADATVYIDPPYAGSESYEHEFSRDTVLETALRWAAAGAHVVVSEGEPLPLPGWGHVPLIAARQHTLGRVPEWLTVSPSLLPVRDERPAHVRQGEPEALSARGRAPEPA